MPVHTADRCRESRTNSGTIALRTPTAANPSARFADAAARYARLRSARPIPASGDAARGRRGRPAGRVPQDRRRDDGGHDEQPAVDEERGPQRPGREEPADRGAADAAHEEAAREQAAGPPPLIAGHADQEQGLGADAEHRRAQAADPAQHDELHERSGDSGQDAARRDDADAGRHHPVLAEPVHQPARGQGPEHPQQGKRADHAGGRGGADPEVTGERRDVRGDDPEPERDGERDRREDGHLGRHALEGTAMMAGHQGILPGGADSPRWADLHRIREGWREPFHARSPARPAVYCGHGYPPAPRLRVPGPCLPPHGHSGVPRGRAETPRRLAVRSPPARPGTAVPGTAVRRSAPRRRHAKVSHRAQPGGQSESHPLVRAAVAQVAAAPAILQNIRD